jgi:hypothetical protein
MSVGTSPLSAGLWAAVVVLAASSIFAAAFALGSGVIGILLGGACVLAVADLFIFKAIKPR